MSSRVGRRTISGTVGTTAVQVLAAGKASTFLKVHNPSNGNFLAVTYDGQTTPVINGAGTTLTPFGTDTSDESIPAGPVMLVADAAGVPYTIEYG